jgi:hypothetical protein
MRGLQRLAALIIFFSCCVSTTIADDIDKAFGAQTKSEKTQTRTDRSVQSANDESRQGVVTRALAREQARREEMNRLASSSVATENEPKSVKASNAAAGNFTCDFMCSTVNIIEADHRSPLLNLSINANGEQQARDLAGPSAKSVCWDQFKMVPYQRWGIGFLKCKKN